MGSLTSSAVPPPPHDPELERRAIADLVMAIAIDLAASGGELVISESEVSLTPYDAGIGPTDLFRLVYQASVTPVTPDPAIAAELVRAQGFVATTSNVEDATGEGADEFIVEATNDAGAYLWLSWHRGVDELVVRVELPPATYDVESSGSPPEAR